MKYNLIILIITMLYNEQVRCRSLGSKCKEDLDWINSLVLERVEEKAFSVEPALGVGVPAKPKLDSTIEELVQMILESNDTLSAWRVRECLGRYLKEVKPWRPQLSEGSSGSPGQLGYDPPHYLGPIEPFPVPVPEDEDYRPGAEGYTTYINPYNFMNKVPEFFKPRPSSDDDYDDYSDSSEEVIKPTTTSPDIGDPSPSQDPFPDDIFPPKPIDHEINPLKPSAQPIIETITTTMPPISDDYYDDYAYDDYYK